MIFRGGGSKKKYNSEFKEGESLFIFILIFNSKNEPNFI